MVGLYFLSGGELSLVGSCPSTINIAYKNVQTEIDIAFYICM